MPRHSCFLLCLFSVSPLLAHAADAAAVDTAAAAARVLPQPAVDIVGGAGSVSPEPLQPRAKPTRRLVYSCVAPALVTFADRPCGMQPVLRELVVQPGIRAGSAMPPIGDSRNRPRRHDPAAGGAAVGTRQADVADETTKHDDACRKLQTRLDQVDAQMRAGYAAAEAGRLWDRWRDAKQRLRENRC